jgi:hypothetical protein
MAATNHMILTLLLPTSRIALALPQLASQRLTGCFYAAGCLQDAKRSDPMDGFCQLFGVPRWLRQATRLMAGLEVTLSGDMLVVKQVRQQTMASFSLAYS